MKFLRDLENIFIHTWLKFQKESINQKRDIIKLRVLRYKCY